MATQSAGTTRSEEAQVLAVALAAAVAIVVGEGPFSLWSTVTGCMLLLFLWSFPISYNHNRVEQFAIGAVFSLCVLLAFGFLLNYVPDDANLAFTELDAVSRPIGSEDEVEFRLYRKSYDPLNLRDIIGFSFWGVSTLAIGIWRCRNAVTQPTPTQAPGEPAKEANTVQAPTSIDGTAQDAPNQGPS